jgi:hypothetical protein
MAEVLIVDDIEYPEYEQGIPQPQRMYATKLKEYIEIHPTHYKRIKLYWEMLYKTKDKNEYYNGTIIQIISPTIYILKNKYHQRIWSIDISKYTVLLRDYETVYQENRRKENLWQLYQAGLVTIDPSVSGDADGDADDTD